MAKFFIQLNKWLIFVTIDALRLHTKAQQEDRQPTHKEKSHDIIQKQLVIVCFTTRMC